MEAIDGIRMTWERSYSSETSSVLWVIVVHRCASSGNDSIDMVKNVTVFDAFSTELLTLK